MNIPSHIEKQLEKRKQQHLLRSLTLSTGEIDFFSNDYLGLAQQGYHIHRAAMDLLARYAGGTPVYGGASGSRLISGNSNIAMDFEAYLADFFRHESALFFSSGYLANMGLFSALPQKGDTVLYDELSHACIKDGIRLSPATKYPFKHNSVADLEKKMAKALGNIYVAVESIYSMDGDVAPLADIVELCQKYNAFLLVDEAHSTGIYGHHGAGLVVELGLENHILARVHTFGKAVGAHGACVIAPKKLIDYLVNFCRPFIYTTAPAFAQIAHVWAALQYLKTHYSQLKNALFDNISYFNHLKCASKHSFLPSNSAIQAVMCSGNTHALKLNQHLNNQKINTKAILSPTVKAGEERIRICLHSFNTEKELLHLFGVLNSGMP